MGRLIDIDSLKGCAIIRPTRHETIEHIKQCGDDCLNHDDIPTAYNNSWIPCSEKLPEDDSICIVTVEYSNNKTVVDYGWFDRKGVCWFVGMQEFRTSNILAWQTLPAPYQPKGE